MSSDSADAPQTPEITVGPVYTTVKNSQGTFVYDHRPRSRPVYGFFFETPLDYAIVGYSMFATVMFTVASVVKIFG